MLVKLGGRDSGIFCGVLFFLVSLMECLELICHLGSIFDLKEIFGKITFQKN
jgi:hypothetical protein